MVVQKIVVYLLHQKTKTRTMKNVELNSVKKFLKEGNTAHEVASKLNMSYFELHQALKSQDTSIRKIKREMEIKPQVRAWETIRKNNAIEAYQSATSAGIKASISRKFRKDFNLDIKSEISKTEIARILAPKVKVKSNKEAFAKKEVELMLPKKLQAIIDEQNRRITALEKMLQK